MARVLNVTPEALRAGTDWGRQSLKNVSSQASEILTPPPFQIVTSQLPFQKHLDSALRLNAKLVRHLQSLIEKRPNKMELLCFLRNTWADSGVEALYWLNLCSAQTYPVELAPQPLGLREHQAICPVSSLPVGDVARLGLWLPGETPVAFFPQTTITTSSRPVRVDCLTCVGHNRWLVIEVDGGGHDGRWDELRTASLAYPVWRYNTSEVQYLDLLPRIIKRIRSTFPGTPH